MQIKIKKFIFEELLHKVLLTKADYVELIAADGVLDVLGTSRIMAIAASTDQASIEVEGRASLPAKPFVDIVESSDEGYLTIKVTNSSAQITSGTAQWDLKLRWSNFGFGPLRIEDGIEYHHIDSSKFTSALDTVKYAADRVFKFDYLLIDNKSVYAFDYQRLHQVKLGDDFPSFTFDIGINTVDSLLEFLRSTTESLFIASVGNRVIFKSGSSYMVVYKKRHPKADLEKYLLRPALSNTQELLVYRQQLIDALNRFKVIDSNVVLLDLSNSSLLLVAGDRSGKKAQEKLEVKWKRKGRILVVNKSHLLDMIEHFDDDICRFYFAPEINKTAKSLLLLKSSDGNNLALLAQLAEGTHG